MPSEQRGWLTFLYRGNTFVRKNIRVDYLGARLTLLCNKIGIRIFSLETEDGTWPPEAAAPGHKIKYSRSIASLFPNTKSEGRVHFRVENAPLCRPIDFTSTKSCLKIRKHPRQNDREAKTWCGDQYAIASSSLDLEDVEKIYDPLMLEDRAAFPVKKLEENFIEKLVAIVEDERKAFESTKRATAVRRLQHSVTKILGAVVTLLEGNFSTKMKPLLANELVLAGGKPDLLVTWKQWNTRKSVASSSRNLVLIDVAIADNEDRDIQASPVFGIVSTFSDWVFYEHDETGIRYLEESLNDNERSIKGDVCENHLQHDGRRVRLPPPPASSQQHHCCTHLQS